MREELKTELMDWNGCEWVESVPERMHGTPVVLGTRMDADGVLVNFDDGMTAEEISDEFGVPHAAVAAILDHARRARTANAA